MVHHLMCDDPSLMWQSTATTRWDDDGRVRWHSSEITDMQNTNATTKTATRTAQRDDGVLEWAIPVCCCCCCCTSGQSADVLLLSLASQRRFQRSPHPPTPQTCHFAVVANIVASSD